MAQEQVNGIIQALVAGQHARNEQIRLSQEALAQEQASESRKQTIQLEHDRLDQENKHFDISMKAAQAMKDVQTLETKLKIAGAPYSQVRALPGVTETPSTMTTPVTSGMHIEQQDPNNVIMNVPGLGSITHPNTAGELANTTAEVQAKQAPLTAARLQEIDASKLADEARLKVQQEYENSRNELTRNAQIQIGKSHDAARMAAAEIAKGGTLDPELISQTASDALNGNLSVESLNKLPISKAHKEAIVQTLNKSGGKLPSQKQLDSVSAFAPVASMIPKILEYGKILADNPFASRTPGMDAYKRAKALQQELDLTLPNVARVIASDTGRLSNQQIAIARGAEEPTVNFLTGDADSNLKKAKEFMQVVNASIDARLSNLPEAQRATIKAKIGIPAFGEEAAGPRILKFDAQGNPVK